MRICRALIGVLIAFLPLELTAQDLFGPENVEAHLDLRASVAGGEPSWLQGGFGKLREGGDDGEARARIRVASADLVWKPQLSWQIDGMVSVSHQGQNKPDIDLSEAYLSFRGSPALTRFSARAGVFWPPISQEHGGANWRVLDTITPSAANSWVGEEIKVLGLEGTVERAFGEHELSLTGSLFMHNDMSGTLLSYRGWALHDVKAGVFSDLPLPPLSSAAAPYQDEITSPFWEVDGRIGFYGRAEWRPPLPLTVNILRYDNRGDRVASRAMQTSWRTRFWNLGVALSLGSTTVAKSQVMWGNTLVGPDTPFGIPVDVDFVTTYLLVGQEVGTGMLTVRADWFETRDNSFVANDNNNEAGWSAAIAYKHPVRTDIDALLEVLHVNSNRPARSLNAGIAPRQDQLTFQSSIRFRL